MKSINAAPPRPGHHITCRDIWMPQVYYYFNRMKVFDYILTTISRENFSFFSMHKLSRVPLLLAHTSIIQNVHSFVSNFLGLLFSDVVVVVVIIVVIVLVSFVIGVIHSC